MGCSATQLRVRGLSLFLCIYSLILQTSPWYTWFVSNLMLLGLYFTCGNTCIVLKSISAWRLHEKHHLCTENFTFCQSKQSQDAEIKSKIVQWLRWTFWTAFVHQDERALKACKQFIHIPLLFLGYLLYKTAIIRANCNA